MMDPGDPEERGLLRADQADRAEGLRAEPRRRASRCRAGTHHPGADVGEVIAVAMQHVLPDARGAADLQDRHPDDHHRRRPAHRRVVHRPLGRGVRGLVQRGEGHGRVGRAERERSATSGRRPPRSTRRSTRTSSGAATTAPTPAARVSGAASAAATTRRKCCVDAKVYTYVVGMKYPMPGICGGENGAPNEMIIRYGSDDPFRVAAHRRLGADRAPAQRVMYDYGGGGGWGDPLDRDPQAVLDDVLDEYVSVEGAAPRLRRRAHRLARRPHARGRRRRDRPAPRRATRRRRRAPDRWATGLGSTSGGRSPTSSA